MIDVQILTIGSVLYSGLLLALLIDLCFIKQKRKDVLTRYLEEEEKKGTTNKGDLKFEYDRCQEMVIHYDTMNWQIGSILVGSNIVALAFSGKEPLLFALPFAGMLSMFLWAFWFLRHMALYNLRNDRLFVIEKKLGLRQYQMALEIRDSCSRHRWLGIVSGYVTACFLTIGLATVWYWMLWLI